MAPAVPDDLSGTAGPTYHIDQLRALPDTVTKTGVLMHTLRRIARFSWTPHFTNSCSKHLEM